ncbi:MAG: transketolase [Oscillospiraceae bacterium]|nr:transketolase [Oscillospiraceae bacterium]
MLTKKEIKELNIFACEIRKATFSAIHGAGRGHIGGAMSMVEALAVLYGKEMKIDPKEPRMPERDRFVLSKGHCGPSLYATLAVKGFFPREALPTMNHGGTILPSHVDRLKTPGIDFSAGSLGTGISVAVGSALGAKVKGLDYRTYCIVGDGECDEGQVWEAAMFAASKKLDNLVVLVDYNKQQLDGWTKDVCDLGDIGAKFSQFGWNTVEVDGHNVSAIYDALEAARACKGQPTAIILDTVKGKGCSYAEKAGLCHHLDMTDEQFAQETALQDARIDALRKEED